MPVRIGEVVEKKGDMLTVVFERPAACENCDGCLDKRCVSMEVAGGEAAYARCGDQVEVAMPDRAVVKASALAYGTPLALLIAGLLLGAPVHAALGLAANPDLFAGALGAVALAVGLLIVYGADRRIRKGRSWQPRVVAVRSRAGGMTAKEKGE